MHHLPVQLPSFEACCLPLVDLVSQLICEGLVLLQCSHVHPHARTQPDRQQVKAHKTPVRTSRSELHCFTEGVTRWLKCNAGSCKADRHIWCLYTQVRQTPAPKLRLRIITASNKGLHSAALTYQNIAMAGLCSKAVITWYSVTVTQRLTSSHVGSCCVHPVNVPPARHPQMSAGRLPQQPPMTLKMLQTM